MPAPHHSSFLQAGCFSKIWTVFTFLVPALQDSLEKRPLNMHMSVCVDICQKIQVATVFTSIVTLTLGSEISLFKKIMRERDIA